MSFLASNIYLDFFFKKEEPPKDPPKPPNIFGGLSVKSTPIAPKNSETFVLNPKAISRPAEQVFDRKNEQDPFREIVQTSEEKNFAPMVVRKNDVNSIEFLLDLTMPEEKSGLVLSSHERTRKQSDQLERKGSEEIRKGESTQLSYQNPPGLEKEKKIVKEFTLIGQSTIEKNPKNEEREVHSQPVVKENKFKQKIDEQKRKEQEAKEKIEIEKMQKEIEEKRRQEEISDPKGLQKKFEFEFKAKKDLISHFVSEQHAINDIQANLQKNLEEMNEKIKDCEVLANEAAGKEDFELAAKFSDDLDSVRLQIMFTTKEFEKKSDEYLEFEFKKSEIYLEQEKLISEYKEKISTFIRTIQEKNEENEKELEQIKSRKSEYVQSSASELEEKKIEIETLAQNVEEKKKDVNEKIHNKTSDLQETKKKMLSSVEELEKEIEELRKCLEGKIKLVREVQKELSEVNEEIKRNVTEFDDEVKEFEAAEQLLIEENSIFQEKLEKHEGKEQEFSEEIEKRLKSIEENQKNLAVFEECFEGLDKESVLINEIQSKRQETIENITKTVSILKDKREILKEAEDYLETFNTEIQKITEEIAKSQEREKELQIKLPILEMEKKNAAANKNFKVLHT